MHTVGIRELVALDATTRLEQGRPWTGVIRHPTLRTRLLGGHDISAGIFIGGFHLRQVSQQGAAFDSLPAPKPISPEGEAGSRIRFGYRSIFRSRGARIL